MNNTQNTDAHTSGVYSTNMIMGASLEEPSDIQGEDKIISKSKPKIKPYQKRLQDKFLNPNNIAIFLRRQPPEVLEHLESENS